MAALQLFQDGYDCWLLLQPQPPMRPAQRSLSAPPRPPRQPSEGHDADAQRIMEGSKLWAEGASPLLTDPVVTVQLLPQTFMVGLQKVDALQRFVNGACREGACHPRCFHPAPQGDRRRRGSYEQRFVLTGEQSIPLRFAFWVEKGEKTAPL